MRKWLVGATSTGSAIGAWCFQGEPVSEFAGTHKYLGADPKAFTYTITSILEIAKPFDIADMTDDYQDARLLSQNEDSATVEVTYYPLNTVLEGLARIRIGSATMRK